MRKRSFTIYPAVLLLIISLSLGLAGCGGSSGNHGGNSPGGDETVDGNAIAPTFSPAPVENTWAPVQVTLTSRTSGALIKYTTDGSDPKTNSKAVVFASLTPIIVDKPMTIKAYAFKTGVGDSDVSEANYDRKVVAKEVAFLSHGNVFVYSSDGSGWENNQQSQLTDFSSTGLVSKISMTSTGKLLFFSNDNLDPAQSAPCFYLMDVNTTPATVSAVSGMVSSDTGAFISASGNQIVFWSNDRETPKPHYAIYTRNSNGEVKKFADITSSDVLAPISISKDGTKVVTLHYINANNCGLYLFTEGATPQLIVAALAAYPVISPDGFKVAYVVGGDIYIMNIDGSGTPQKITNCQCAREPAWSFDGTRLAYIWDSVASPDKCGVHIINSDGTQDYLVKGKTQGAMDTGDMKSPVLR
jgi:Periplasmic component of the Tol biopolymer transport system